MIILLPGRNQQLETFEMVYNINFCPITFKLAYKSNMSILQLLMLFATHMTVDSWFNQ